MKKPTNSMIEKANRYRCPFIRWDEDKGWLGLRNQKGQNFVVGNAESYALCYLGKNSNGGATTYTIPTTYKLGDTPSSEWQSIPKLIGIDL